MRKLYPGGNTSVGFYSFYHYILPADAAKLIILKGGPGVGKSSFMRYIAEKVLIDNHEVEFLCCSSDNDSYDGVVFPTVQTAIIDGTAPHMVDPKNPGAVDEIIHLGDYWNEKGIQENRDTIIRLNKLIGQKFLLAYNYLAQAELLNRELEMYQADTMDFFSLNKITARIISKIFPGEGNWCSERHLFASAVTPNGPVNYLSTIFDEAKHRIIITGPPGTGKATIVKRIYRQAMILNYKVEAFHCSLDPKKIEHLYLPELNLGVITSNKHHSYQAKQGDTIINTVKYIKPHNLSSHNKNILKAEERFDSALKQAVDFIAQAKENHDKLESYYIPNMDFDAVNKRRDETLLKISNYFSETH